MTRPRRAVVIGSLGYSLVNFRLDLMRRLQANGYAVLALAAQIDAATAAVLEAEGIAWQEIPLERTGTSPLRDLACLRAVWAVLRQQRPELVLAYTMKPILYGCLAAQLAGVPRRYALFTGLGYGFMEARPRGRRRRVRAVAVLLHRLALRRLTAAFCYNSADRADIRRFRLIPPQVPLHDVPGSGVDTARFAPAPLPAGPQQFLFAGRLLRSKGLEVLAAAARILRQKQLSFRLQVLGGADSNPDAIDPQQLARWQAEGLLTQTGFTRDVRPWLQGCSVFVLPTRLREGIPRSILEAMASGRAVITTDAPGCGETLGGAAGLTVPQNDPEALAAAMEAFIRTPALARRMGAAARDRACRVYDVHRVNHLLMQHMGIEPAAAPGAPAAALHPPGLAAL